MPQGAVSPVNPIQKWYLASMGKRICGRGNLDLDARGAIRALRAATPPVGAAAIARMLGISRGRVYQLLCSMDLPRRPYGKTKSR
jgi:hypothetical protein